MYIEGFGNKKITVYSVEGTTDLFLVEFKHKGKKYNGIIDEAGRTLVKMSDCPILEAFATKDCSNYCFTIQNQVTGAYESFHLVRKEDNKFYLRADIKGNDVTNCRLVGTVKDDYWFIESTTDGITEFNLYGVRQGKILTPKFTEISFEEEESRVLAYVEKDVNVKNNGEYIYLTSLLSFIDYNGKFVCPIYDTELDKIYDARSYNFDESFKSFNCFLDSVASKSYERYNEKSQHVTDVLSDMFLDLYSVDEMKNKKGPAKVLEFRRVNND